MLAKKEKQNLVITLYKQGKTVREIAKEVHMSFSDISAIIKQEFGQEDVSKDAQIFKLFEKGTKPIDIAIKFNISANEVQRLHKEYRNLCEMNELNKIYDELGDKTESLVELYKTMRKLSLSSEEISKAVKYGSDLPILEIKYESLKDEVKQIETQKQDLTYEIENLKSTNAVLNHTIGNLDKVLEQRTNKVKSLDCEIRKLQSKILWMMGSKGYTKIRDIARQQVESILMDKRALLLTNLAAVIEAFKLDPEKQILISNMTDANPSSYIEQRNELLELAEQRFNGLANDLVSVTLNSINNLELDPVK